MFCNKETGSIVACYCATEPEAWFLGRVMVSSWKARSATTQKIQECIGGTHFFEELEGEDGQVIVPAENIICTGVEVIHKGMPRNVAEAAMGEDWMNLDPTEVREILTSQYLYLGLPQREIIWSKSPQ